MLFGAGACDAEDYFGVGAWLGAGGIRLNEKGNFGVLEDSR
jgi:hypothetical protein